MVIKKEKLASEVLEGVVKNGHADYLSLGEISRALHERGFGLLMIIFALVLIFLPPGLTAIPAFPIIFFAIQMIAGKSSPWLPKWLATKTIKRSSLASLVVKAAPKLSKVEKLLKPRLSFAASRTGERVIGVFAFIFALSIVVPLPLTNFLPAIGIILMSLGMLSKDGVPVILGMLVGTFGVIVTTTVLLIGKKAVIELFEGMSAASL